MTTSKRVLSYPGGLAIALGIALWLGGAPVAASAAQWTVVSLHPETAAESMAVGVAGNLQAGWANYPARRATFWAGTAASAATIASSPSEFTGTDGIDSVGIFGAHAVLWRGPTQALSDLDIGHRFGSVALGVAGGQQVGWAGVGDETHAALWSGTSESFADLNPTGAVGSVLIAVDATGIAGNYNQSKTAGSHAALWHGTAESVVNLHPAGAYASSAQAISSGRQGGYVQFERNGPAHAALWSGTPESYVDVTPSFVWTAGINGMDAGIQAGVGVPVDTSDFHALVWFGTAGSCLDLHAFLSSDYTKSEARAVDIDEFGTIRVVGYAWNNNYYLPNGTYYPRNEAMMWVLVPEPSSLFALAAGLAGLAGVSSPRSRWTRPRG